MPIGGKNISIPLVRAGTLGAGNTGALNVSESYTIDMVVGDRRAVVNLGRTFDLIDLNPLAASGSSTISPTRTSPQLKWSC